MACEHCYAYVYDMLVRPMPRFNTFMFAPLINLKRGMRRPHDFVDGFIRAGSSPKEAHRLAVLFTEAGGVTRPKKMTISSPLPIASIWVDLKLKEIGDLQELHFLHMGGFKPEPLVAVPPPAPAPAPTGLRIRIPKRRNSIT